MFALMGFSIKFVSLVGIILIEGTLKAGAICKEDQSKICRSIDEGYSTDNRHHPNAGSCVVKHYNIFTHVCTVVDYSIPVAFCCCSTQKSHTTTSLGYDKSEDTLLCCHYFQSWNTFRCDEEKDVVPPSTSSNLASVRVWTISLILFAAISLFTLMLIGCLRKSMTNRKKALSDSKPDRFNNNNNLPDQEFEKHHHHHQRSSSSRELSLHYFPPTKHVTQSVVPLIPSAPSMDESYREVFNPQATVFGRRPQHLHNNNDIGANDSLNKRDFVSASEFLNNLDLQNEFKGCHENVTTNCNMLRDSIYVEDNMLRDSIYVEDNIEINDEPPPPYDEVVGLYE